MMPNLNDDQGIESIRNCCTDPDNPPSGLVGIVHLSARGAQ